MAILVSALAGCPALTTVTGPDGEPLGEDECLLTLQMDGSCDGCEGFEGFEIVIGDADGETWEFLLDEGESWVQVVARGGFMVDYTALLFGSQYVYGPEEFNCDRTHELSLGCEGFDFCVD